MNLATWTSANIGKHTYDLGRMDCFRIVLDFASDAAGFRLPVAFDGMSLAEYPLAYEKNPESTIDLAVRYLDAYLKPIPSLRAVAGDILVLLFRGVRFFGIDGGNGNVITVTEDKGLRVLRRGRGIEILRAYTWPHP